MPYLRRDFLKGFSFVAGAAMLGHPFFACANVLQPEGSHLIIGSRKSLCAIDLTSKLVRRVPLGFTAHGFVQNPQMPERIWAIEKWGVAAEVDFRQEKIVRKLTLPEGKYFFGHGAFSQKGDVLFIVQEDLKTGLGHLLGYDFHSSKPVLDYQVTLGGLHECRLLEKNTLFVASNGSPWVKRPNLYGTLTVDSFGPMREKSSLVKVNLQDGSILEKKFIEDKDQILGHFFVTKAGKILAISTPRPDAKRKCGAAYFGALDSPVFQRITWPDEVDSLLRDEFLSIAVNTAENVAVVTNPLGGVLLFIDLDTGKFIGHVQMSASHGVAFDSQLERFICSGDFLETLDEKAEHRGRLSVKTASGEGVTSFDSTHSLVVRMPAA